MDFFERFLHISPDRGTGTTEVLWLTLVLFAVSTYIFLRTRSKTRSHCEQSPDQQGE